MALDDNVTTSRADVLSMIACADTYGHNNQITRHWFWRLLNYQLDLSEIRDFAKNETASDIYGPEDYSDIVDRLTDFVRLVSD